MIPRTVEPEWLDILAPSDPEALRSRDDLRRVNQWMLQARIMARLLASCRGDQEPLRLVELGAGDGTFMLSVAARLARRWPAVRLTLVDQHDIVSAATLKGFDELGWYAEAEHADVFDFLRSNCAGSADIVAANLFLHHFGRDQLQRLLAGIAAMTNAFVACEPRRVRSALAASRLLGIIGCNAVSRHDAVTSVRAGFRDSELSQLWPDQQHWMLREGPAPPFTHSFCARRRGGVL